MSLVLHIGSLSNMDKHKDKTATKHNHSVLQRKKVCEDGKKKEEDGQNKGEKQEQQMDNQVPDDEQSIIKMKQANQCEQSEYQKSKGYARKQQNDQHSDNIPEQKPNQHQENQKKQFRQPPKHVPSRPMQGQGAKKDLRQKVLVKNFRSSLEFLSENDGPTTAPLASSSPVSGLLPMENSSTVDQVASASPLAVVSLASISPEPSNEELLSETASSLLGLHSSESPSPANQAASASPLAVVPLASISPEPSNELLSSPVEPLVCVSPPPGETLSSASMLTLQPLVCVSPPPAETLSSASMLTLETLVSVSPPPVETLPSASMLTSEPLVCVSPPPVETLPSASMLTSEPLVCVSPPPVETLPSASMLTSEPLVCVSPPPVEMLPSASMLTPEPLVSVSPPPPGTSSSVLVSANEPLSLSSSLPSPDQSSCILDSASMLASEPLVCISPPAADTLASASVLAHGPLSLCSSVPDSDQTAIPLESASLFASEPLVTLSPPPTDTLESELMLASGNLVTISPPLSPPRSTGTGTSVSACPSSSDFPLRSASGNVTSVSPASSLSSLSSSSLTMYIVNAAVDLTVESLNEPGESSQSDGQSLVTLSEVSEISIDLSDDSVPADDASAQQRTNGISQQCSDELSLVNLLEDSEMCQSIPGSDMFEGCTCEPKRNGTGMNFPSLDYNYGDSMSNFLSPMFQDYENGRVDDELSQAIMLSPRTPHASFMKKKKAEQKVRLFSELDCDSLKRTKQPKLPASPGLYIKYTASIPSLAKDSPVIQKRRKHERDVERGLIRPENEACRSTHRNTSGNKMIRGANLPIERRVSRHIEKITHLGDEDEVDVSLTITDSRSERAAEWSKNNKGSLTPAFLSESMTSYHTFVQGLRDSSCQVLADSFSRTLRRRLHGQFHVTCSFDNAYEDDEGEQLSTEFLRKHFHLRHLTLLHKSTNKVPEIQDLGFIRKMLENVEVMKKIVACRMFAKEEIHSRCSFLYCHILHGNVIVYLLILT